MAPASRRSSVPGACVPGACVPGAAGRGSRPRCFSSGQCDGAAPPRPAQPSRPMPLKSYLDMVVSSWQGRHPPAPSPPRRLLTSCCQNFASPSSLSSPWGSRNETRGHPSPGRDQIPGPWGRDRSPRDLLPWWELEGSGGRGGNTRGGGQGRGQDGCARGTTCSCLRSLQRGGDASGAAAACQVLGPGGERWPQVPGIVRQRWPRPGLGGRGRGQQRSHHFTS